MKHSGISRKDFLKKSVIVSGLSPLLSHKFFNLASQGSSPGSSLEIHVFSKHFQFLGYDDMASAAAEIGFDGVDLTVRPRGHVLPENVTTDLPKAADAISKAGLKSSMMTTAVTDVHNEIDRRVLETASETGFSFYRMGYLRYSDDKSMQESMSKFQVLIKELSELNEKLGLIGCYQNHASRNAGASIWEKNHMLSDARSDYMGSQYDIRHAIVEGGNGWENGLRLIHPRIRTVALKDHKWEKVDGRWRVVNTPIGEGMVDFKHYFGLLKKYNVYVPASLHYEYPLGGVEHGNTQITESEDVIFRAMKKDLNKIRGYWRHA